MDLFAWDKRVMPRWAVPHLYIGYRFQIKMNSERYLNEFVSEFMTNYQLNHSQPFGKVLILSHGFPGSLQFSRGDLNMGNVEQLRPLHGKVHKIKLLGCEIAQGESGQAFCTRIARVTGALVTASANTQVIGLPESLNRWEGDVLTFNANGIVHQRAHDLHFDGRGNPLAN